MGLGCSGLTQKPDSIEQLLLEWQSTGDERTLEELFKAISPLIESVSRHVLRSNGIVDPGAIDDATSKVFDHLRRLHGPSAGDRRVAAFRPAAPHVTRRGDAGIGFIRWLSQERARDIARATFRRTRRTRLFSQLAPEHAGMVQRIEARPPPDGGLLDDDVLLAIESLDGRLRLVIDLLLEGESQATIARRMGVCEGTVSRIHARAIEALREAIRGPSEPILSRRPPFAVRGERRGPRAPARPPSRARASRHRGRPAPSASRRTCGRPESRPGR